MGKVSTETARRAIRVWLAEHDKTQVWLAFKIGMDEGRFSKMLSGYMAPSEDVADKLLKVTGIDIREFSKVA